MEIITGVRLVPRGKSTDLGGTSFALASFTL